MKSRLDGLVKFSERKPERGQAVIWIWSYAGYICAGDYWKGKVRDASHNYAHCPINPTHWMEWPENWPS